MKEQDFIDNINEKTNNLPIPDSISPEAMKKMLDEHIENKSTNTNNTDISDNPSLKTDSSTTKHIRYTRRFAAAACLVLCIAGSFGVSKLLSQKPQNESVKNESDQAQSDAVASEEESFSNDLAYQTDLQVPASYDDYYDTLKRAYDDYYDSIASVETYFDEDMGDKEYAEKSAAAPETEAVEDTAGIQSNSMDTFRSDTASTKTSSEKGSAKEDYSTTNTQEKTVDEGDVIKTDGTYIYKVISNFDNDTGYTGYHLTITKTDNGNLSFVTSFDLEDAIKHNENDYIQFREFYLYNDQLIIMYSVNNYEKEIAQNDSYIVIYNLKDKANPKKVKTLSQSGYYESSRISDGYLYTISNFSDTSLVEKKDYDSYIPSVNGKTIACGNIYCPKDVIMDTTYVITSLDLNNPEDFADTKAVPTSGGQTYVSDAAIYLYATLYDDVTKTEIMKIAYDKGTLTVGNSAVVAGYLYDSFALSEYDGHLRIVATIPANNISLLRFTDDVITKNSTNSSITEDINALYVLNEKMELTGKITGLAPGERIYSARFMGETGYFVTYENTDPLFSVDLSDPSNPTILGKLKIPGFSNYLHFYGENTLLGIGEETDPNTQEFLGLKLSMFDISDPADVKEEDKYIIENSDFSYALYNHKAIMINPEKNVFGFLYYGEKGNSYEYGYRYATYTYDEENGFIETASYEIDDGSEYESDAVRGLYIGDYFYLATNQSITSYELGSEDPIAQVYLK